MNKIELVARIEEEMDANVQVYADEKEELQDAFWYYIDMLSRVTAREDRIAGLDAERKRLMVEMNG